MKKNTERGAVLTGMDTVVTLLYDGTSDSSVDGARDSSLPARTERGAFLKNCKKGRYQTVGEGRRRQQLHEASVGMQVVTPTLRKVRPNYTIAGAGVSSGLNDTRLGRHGYRLECVAVSFARLE